MSLKKSLWDYGKSILRELLREPEKAEGSKPASLDDLKLDDLKREKVRLELEERKTLSEVKDLEAQKRRLFDEGVKAAGSRESKVIARKIKEVDSQANNMDRLLDTLSQQMRLINGLVRVKEMARIQKESGIGAMLQDMDLQDLVIYIDNATIDGDFNTAKFDEMLKVVENPVSGRGTAEDQDVKDIMKAFEAAREAQDNPEVLDQKFNEMNQKIEEKRKAKENPEDSGY